MVEKIDLKPTVAPQPVKTDISATRLKKIVEDSIATGMV
jgi:hypothetical protein